MSENLPNVVLVTYPDLGYGSLFQFHEPFTTSRGILLQKRTSEIRMSLRLSRASPAATHLHHSVLILRTKLGELVAGLHDTSA